MSKYHPFSVSKNEFHEYDKSLLWDKSGTKVSANSGSSIPVGEDTSIACISSAKESMGVGLCMGLSDSWPEHEDAKRSRLKNEIDTRRGDGKNTQILAKLHKMDCNIFNLAKT